MASPSGILTLIRTSLQARVVLLMLAIFCVISIAAYIAFDRIIATTTVQLGQLFAERQVQFDRYRGLETLMREASLAQTLARSPAITAWARDEDDPVARTRGLAELEHFRTAFRDNSYFFVIDASGNYYFNDHQNRYAGDQWRYSVQADNPRDGWYFATKASPAECQLNVDHDDNLAVTNVWINCQVRHQGQTIGVVGTGIDLSSFIREVVDIRQRGVESIFIDRSGAIQAHRDPEQIDFHSLTKDIKYKNTVFNLLDREEDRAAVAAMMERAASRQDAVETGFVRIDGKKVLAGIGYLDQLGWFNLTLMDVDQIIDNNMFRPIAALLALILAAATLLATVLFKRSVLDRLATLEIWVARLRSGDFGTMRAPAGIDEIGRLTTAFGEMARTVGDNTQRLEAMVQERTEKLERLAYLDPLTEVENRRGFLRAVEQERNPSRSRMVGQQGGQQVGLGLVLLDLDLFKPINDRFGHKAGDEVLVEIAARLKAALPARAHVGRWGGDEFILLVPAADQAGLLRAAEQARTAVVGRPYPLEQGRQVEVSACAGATMVDGDTDIDTLIARADAALYTAKHSGARAVMLYQPGMDGGDEAAAARRRRMPG